MSDKINSSKNYVISFSSLPSSSYLIENGNVFSFGRNDAFQLGQKDTSARYEPTFVQLISKVKSVGAGYQHTLFLLETGEVYFVGGGPYIQNKFVKNPSLLEGAPKKVKFVSAGFSHSMLIDENNILWAFGTNSYGELGSGDEKPSFIPVKVALPSNTTVLSVSCGANFTVCITSNHEAFSWGTNTLGQLGVKSNDPKKTIPSKIEFQDQKKITSIACGRDHCLALNEDGIIYSWGCNNDGQLGLNHLNSRNTPSLIVLSNVIVISAGWCHSLALKKENNHNSLWGWGLNSSGQLGTASDTHKKQPSQITFFDESKSPKTIACGNCHSFATTQNNDLYAWGYNGYGQLGFKDTITRVNPTLLMSNSNYHFGEQHQFNEKQNNQVQTLGQNLKILELNQDKESRFEFAQVEEIDIRSKIRLIIQGLHTNPIFDENQNCYQIKISKFVQNIIEPNSKISGCFYVKEKVLAEYLTKQLHLLSVDIENFTIWIKIYEFYKINSFKIIKSCLTCFLNSKFNTDHSNYLAACTFIVTQKDLDCEIFKILGSKLFSFFNPLQKKEPEVLKNAIRILGDIYIEIMNCETVLDNIGNEFIPDPKNIIVDSSTVQCFSQFKGKELFVDEKEYTMEQFCMLIAFENFEIDLKYSCGNLSNQSFDSTKKLLSKLNSHNQLIFLFPKSVSRLTTILSKGDDFFPSIKQIFGNSQQINLETISNLSPFVEKFLSSPKTFVLNPNYWTLPPLLREYLQSHLNLSFRKN